MRNPVTGELRFLAYNSVDDQLYDGVYDFTAPMTIERRYTAYLRDRSVGIEFRDVWEWTNPAKTSFHWLTDMLVDGEYQRSEIVVRWDKTTNDEL